ncbi:MAG: outer membrane beta-barrel protein [Bacteroidia bacterium]|nr:outer membrane beta-barrel protein [Bacteroidia bacterium]
MQKLFLTVLLSCSILISLGQTGRISGTILDAKTGETLPGATALVEGTGKGASADFDGKFAINNVPVGKVTLIISYISYTSKKIPGVEVKEGEPTDISILLDPSSSADLNEVEVVVTLNKENNTALVLQQKNNASVSDGISAETIKRTPDKNTSDVLKRVSGASIQDNRFVVVRGLNERYNAAYLNGAPLPSSESDRKAFAFDIFPSNMLDNLVITKTARADMPGEFAGGIIDISTKSIPEKNFFAVSVSGGYNTITTGKEQIYYKGGKKDWLGIDDGTRAMPNQIPEIENFPYIKNEQAALAKSLPENDWGTYTKKYSPNTSFQLSTGYNIKLKEKDFLGIIASVSYNKTNSFLKAVRNSFSNNIDPAEPSQLDAVFVDDNYSTQILAGGLLNLSCKLNENNSISSKNLFSINSDDRTIIRTGDGNLNDANPTMSKTNAYWFTSNQIKSTQLIGEHLIPKIKLKINWVGSYSGVKRDIPNLRRNTYGRLKYISDPNEPNPYDTTYQAIISPSSVGNDYGGYMFWSRLTENIKSAKLDISRNFKVSPDFSFEIKTGGQVQQRSRVFTARQFGFTMYGSGFPIAFTDSLLFLDQSQIFTNQNMGLIAPNKGGFKITEGTHPQDSYKASSNLTAGFLMTDVKYKTWFRAVLGARVEAYNQKLIYPDVLYVINKKEITKDTTVVDLLPSANLIFSPNDKQNIRLSYSQTLNRPEFREIAPFGFYDFTTLFFTSGNDTLQRAKITNYDLRYEIYPGRGQLFSASLFYKDFLNPIESFARTNANEISYVNSDKASCKGFELEYRIILGTFIKNDTSLIGKILNNLTLFSNFAYIKSTVDVSKQTSKPAEAPNSRTLQGQSPYLLNAGISYVDNVNGFSVSGIVNRVGQRIAVVGNYGSQLDIWESGRTVVDLQASKSFLKNKLEVRFTARDILAKTQIQYFYNKKDYNDKDTRLNKTKDDIIRTVQNGSTYALSISYKF